ncbi:MAG: hypothetical protein WBC51_18350 [Vicinamibacterales bacterium]
MKQLTRIALAAAVVFSSPLIATGRQSTVKPPTTGIPECDKYAAMVTACLPTMCEEERMLMEMELGFALEMIPKQVELKGRQAAAQSCTRDISEAIKNDEYGCYTSKNAGTTAPKPIQLDKILPSATSVTLTLSGKGSTTAADTEVIIMTSISAPPTAIYQLPEWKGQFNLDTAYATPTTAKGSTGNPPIRLEPQTTYCFVIGSSANGANHIYRKGIFTTLPKR